MRTRRLSLVLACAYAATGCGSSPAQDVRAKLEQYAHAVAARQPRTICREILAPALVSRLQGAGITCVEAMSIYVDGVDDPVLSIAKITVNGRHADAVVLASARGQVSSLEALQLVDTGAGWRLTSLASPR